MPLRPASDKDVPKVVAGTNGKAGKTVIKPTKPPRPQPQPKVRPLTPTEPVAAEPAPPEPAAPAKTTFTLNADLVKLNKAVSGGSQGTVPKNFKELLEQNPYGIFALIVGAFLFASFLVIVYGMVMHLRS